MANEVTKLSNVINPQVMGAMIEAKISALCKLTPYAKVDTTLQGVPGDTKTVPSWNYIGDAQDFDPENTTGAEIETAKLTASSTTFTIKCAGKSVAILQTAINSGLGNPIGQAETQLDLSGGESKYTTYNAKIQESTHIFLCDYQTFKGLSGEWVWDTLNFISGEISTLTSDKKVDVTSENARMLIDGLIYQIMLIDDPTNLHQHLEIYLKFVGGQNG